jgi:hypothetical protein
MTFKRGDIVITLPPFREQVLVVYGGDDNKYEVKDPTKPNTYNIKGEGIKKIGEVVPGYFEATGEPKLTNVVSPQVFERGREKAIHESRYCTNANDAERWQILANKKTGESIKLKIRGEENEATFLNVLPRSRKFVFIVIKDGETVRCSLNCVALPQ